MSNSDFTMTILNNFTFLQQKFYILKDIKDKRDIKKIKHYRALKQPIRG